MPAPEPEPEPTYSKLAYETDRMDSIPALDPFARVLPHFVAEAVAGAQGLADKPRPGAAQAPARLNATARPAS